MQCSAGFQEATPSNHHPSYLIHYYILSFKIETGHVSGQIIATSHNLTPNGGFSKGNPRLFQGKLGEGEIYTSWPDVCQTCRWFGLVSPKRSIPCHRRMWSLSIRLESLGFQGWMSRGRCWDQSLGSVGYFTPKKYYPI